MCVLENHDLHVRAKGYRKKVQQGEPLAALGDLNDLEKGLMSMSLG
jgi:hypothetical protein